MKKIFTLTALAISCAANAQAQNSKLEEIVVTSSRVEMPLRQVGTSISVINAVEIQQRGFTSLYEVLRSQPAIAVSNAGGTGSSSALRIRGEEGYRTLVLMDGIDISDPSGPQSSPRFEQLLSAGIQRVEILRGPQGLMYGADAGGVINISSATPEDGFKGQLSAEAGRYQSQQLAANIAGGNETIKFAVSAVDIETDGYNSKTTDNVLGDDDGYENTTLHARVQWDITDALSVHLVGRDVSGENEYDNCFTASFSSTDTCGDDYDQSAIRVAANYQTDHTTNQLSYDLSTTDRTFYSDNIESFSTEGEIERTSYLGSFFVNEAVKLVYGIDRETESINDGSGNKERDQQGYYAEYQGSFGNNLYITAGLRYDDNDDFGTHTSYRVSGAYLFDLSGGELKLKSTYGTGFRAPSLSEIAYNNRPGAYAPAADVELQEEQSKGYDIGLSWYADSGLIVEAVYFDQTIDDEIYFDLIAFSGYLQGNGDSQSKGIELITEIPLSAALTLNGNYTYNNTKDYSGENRVRRPEQLANIGLDWRGMNEKLVLGLNVRGAYDAKSTSGADLDSYEVVDINASYEVTRQLQLFGRIENLLDETYEEVPTYSTSRAAVYAGLRYSF